VTHAADPNRPATAVVLLVARTPPLTAEQATEIRLRPFPTGTTVTVERVVGPYDAVARIAGPLAQIPTAARLLGDHPDIAATLTLAVADGPYEGWTVNEAAPPRFRDEA
jgi:hypothetical protein